MFKGWLGSSIKFCWPCIVGQGEFHKVLLAVYTADNVVSSAQKQLHVARNNLDALGRPQSWQRLELSLLVMCIFPAQGVLVAFR